MEVKPITYLKGNSYQIILRGNPIWKEYLRRKEKNTFRRLAAKKRLSSKVGVNFSPLEKGVVSINPIDAKTNNKGIKILFSAISSDKVQYNNLHDLR